MFTPDDRPMLRGALTAAARADSRAPRAPRAPSVARWVSILAHPFVIAPVLVGVAESPQGAVAAARGVGLVTVFLLLPLAALAARQVSRGAWGNVDASDPRERPVLFLVAGAGLAALLGALALLRPGSPLVAGTAAALALVAVCAVVTPWVKLSLHMANAALAATVLLAHGHPLGAFLGAGLPVLGWSRVALGRHRWVEVVLGGLAGAGAGAALARFA